MTALTSADWKSLNKDALINAVYEVQVDLRILADWLAYEADPMVDADMLWVFETLRIHLSRLTPSHSRH